MAVVVQCYHCNTILELDEGFRGGVCRCSTCGSLLQVPKATTTTAPRARPAAPGAIPSDVQRPAAPGGDTGLSRGQFDPGSSGSGKRPAIPDLGGSSSGLRGGRPATPDFGGSSSGLRGGRPATAQAARHAEKVATVGQTHPAPHVKQVKKNNMLLYVSMAMFAALIMAAVVVAVVVFSRTDTEQLDRGSGASAVKDNGSAPVTPRDRGTPRRNEPTYVEPAAPAPAVAPSVVRSASGFLDVPLTGKKIIFSIDGASSMSDTFDYVRSGVFQAIDRLAADQQVRVALWKDDKLVLYPAKGFINKGEAKLLHQEFDYIGVRGTSDEADSMKRSLELGADQIIFVTAKPSLELGIANDVLAAKKGTVRLDSVKLDSADSPSPLEEMANKTGGTYRFFTGSQLQDMVR